MEEHRYVVDDVTINCARMPGNRVPLVFIHGVTSRWQSWLPVMAAFGARWQVNAVDLRGHGHSSHATGHYGAM